MRTQGEVARKLIVDSLKVEVTKVEGTCRGVEELDELVGTSSGRVIHDYADADVWEVRFLKELGLDQGTPILACSSASHDCGCSFDDEWACHL